MFQSQPIPYVNPAFAQQYNPSAQQFPQQFYGQQFSGPQNYGAGVRLAGFPTHRKFVDDGRP